ncbi:MAG: DNA-binding protein [Thermoplasmata archaeon]|nr:DNA-binding protein [Thermoplasmata archaeon]
MQGKDNGDGFIILKLEDGEDLMDSLRGAVAQFKICSGSVITGIGMLRDIEIGYYTGKERGYILKNLEKPHELISLQGSISTAGETVIHLHCGLANSNHEIVGGHLNRAKVCVLNEIVLKRLDNVVLGRNLNPATGLKELTVR